MQQTHDLCIVLYDTSEREEKVALHLCHQDKTPLQAQRMARRLLDEPTKRLEYKEGECLCRS